MSIYETTTGRAYAADPDYDTFRGRKIGEYTVERKDKRRNCTIYTTYEVIDIGRAAPIRPMQGDELLEPDTLFEEDRSALAKASMAATKKYTAERHDAVVPVFRAAMAEHGPLSIRKLQQITGRSYNFVSSHLREREGVIYQCFEVNDKDYAWGLIGQTYTPKPDRQQYVFTMREVLLEKGPMTTMELSKAVGRSDSSILVAISKHTDWFVKVGERQDKFRKTWLWGLIGIHDQEAV